MINSKHKLSLSANAMLANHWHREEHTFEHKMAQNRSVIDYGLIKCGGQFSVPSIAQQNA